MDDIEVAVRRALVAAGVRVEARTEEVEGPQPSAAQRETLEEMLDDPVGRAILMLLADPSPEGIEQTLAWFYGRGIDDAGAPRGPGDEVLDPRVAVLQALQRCVDTDGVDVIRAAFDRYLPKDPDS